jgi:glycosyltransferase involved in cell wall biosynthesis
LKITILCFDLANNSLGRAALLAQVLSRRHQVELVGSSRDGSIWFPLKDLDIPIRIFPWSRLPKFASTARRMVESIDADLLFACKLWPTSFGVGLLKKKDTGIPLIVDIDDWELGFYLHSGFWGTVGRFLNFSNPNGMPYTWYLEKSVGLADGITVSNRFLQQRFSGEMIYHCRDTSVLDPAKHSGDTIRQELKLQGKKVVMFLGTPRAHKGVDDLIAAVERLPDPDIRLIIIGSDDPEGFLQRRNLPLNGRIVVLPKISFDQLPEYLAVADVLTIPQRDTSDTVGQMPAKIFDAMAMAKPIVSTRVSDIPEVLGDCGYLVDPGNIEQLASALTFIFSHPEEALDKGRKARQRCVELYDTKVMETRLLDLVDRVTQKKVQSVP